MTAGERLKSIRIEKGMTQEELAALLGVSYQVISQYERDLRKPKYETAIKLADALGVSPRHLFLGPSDPDMEYERICDTLNAAGFRIEESTMADEFNVSDADGELEPERIKYSKLADIIPVILKDAEKIKAEYIRKRIELELFWPKGTWIEHTTLFSPTHRGDNNENE